MRERHSIRLIFFGGGMMALAWQVLWAHRLSLALGVSAQGVALTVATTMAGMTLGAWWMGARVQSRAPRHPLRLYAAIELIIAITARLPEWLGGRIADWDATLYQRLGDGSPVFLLATLALTIGPAAWAMGASFPLMGLAARSARLPISALYGWNTAGAAMGIVIVSFWILPHAGLLGGSLLLTAGHLLVATACLLTRTAAPDLPLSDSPVAPGDRPGWRPLALAFVTGLVTFQLEVAWFRLLRSAWFSTADAFAVMLFCFLIALAAGAAIAPRVARWGLPVGAGLGLAAAAVALATPIIGWFDRWTVFHTWSEWRPLWRLLAGLLVMGPPVMAIGILFPALLDRLGKARDWSLLYGVNTAGAVIGSNLAAWVLLPAGGAVMTAWVGAILLAIASLAALRTWRSRGEMAIALAVAGVVAVAMHWGDRDRVLGVERIARGEHQVIAREWGPDADVAVIGFSGGKALMIDGFLTTAQLDNGLANYMDRMGRLPMLLHPAPRSALVICFGTGQTANAVREENPDAIDLVDLSPAVFRMGAHFEANRGVLDDPRANRIVMDGRSWLRRTDHRYDVITLEPMPPYFAGSNSLYSVEFYREAAARLQPGGLIAQWFPLHLLTPEHGRSIAAAFCSVFPDAILWLDPDSGPPGGLPDQAMLIGRLPAEGDRPDDRIFWLKWPGFDRPPGPSPRRLDPMTAARQVWLTPSQLTAYADHAISVTDENLLLEYSERPTSSQEGRKGSAVWVREIHQQFDAARN
ncbi:MAG: hypothetical protein JNK37_08590 [Verrucomicrobiales bacterium]|nr:hypothetical protein [Verrucomicrobiales bacterium]